MEIRYILEKGTAEINEDCLVIQDNIFGVFDGATSLTGRTRFEGKTGGMIASQTAKSVFRRNHYPLKQLACEANDKIMDQMVRHGVNVTRRENLWSTSAAVVRIKDRQLEWIQTGDAFIILIHGDDSHRVLVDREDHDHETLTLWKKLVQKQISRPPGRLNGNDPENGIPALKRALAPQIKKVRLGMNKNYGVLNGEKKAEHFLNQGKVSLEGVREVLLFTDGLSMPRETPEKHKDFTPLVKDYLSLGLDGVKERIRNKEKTDPQCLAFPRFKCHDDIAAIAVTL
ncbi:MAG: protein phosphatase 2C domain-containing protein [Desulfobacter sp.]|nr:MAG: protein phosphatase 2C domain-containing protein [Desulfobacter sp.]